ncbi:MAG: LysR family transcriptional regulator [Blastocatellia bacterium]|nr:LysR family transcriptional regulator [Blastocatellia bacterium]
MELMQLEMLVAAVEEGSIQAAAERVFRTQPAVSIALRKLEEELGAAIFDRTHRRKYELTEAGRILYAQARRMLALRDEAIRSVNERQHLQRGNLRIGAPERLFASLLPDLLAAFARHRPEAAVESLRQPAHRIPVSLRMRHLDFALLPFRPDEEIFDAAHLADDPLVLIVPPSHRLARRSSISIPDLAGEKFIGHQLDSPARQRVLDAFREQRTPLHLLREVASLDQIREQVAKGHGLGILPRLSLGDAAARGEIVPLRIEDLAADRAVWLISLKDSLYAPLALEFQTFVR